MSKALRKQRRAAALAESTGWMSIIHLDKKKFDALYKKVDLKYDSDFSISDPVQRLMVTLRFLVTGEGFEDSLERMFMDTFEKIFGAMEDNMKVRKLSLASNQGLN